MSTVRVLDVSPDGRRVKVEVMKVSLDGAYSLDLAGESWMLSLHDESDLTSLGRHSIETAVWMPWSRPRDDQGRYSMGVGLGVAIFDDVAFSGFRVASHQCLPV